MRSCLRVGPACVLTPSVYAPVSARGRVIKELNWRRTDLIITTKIFFGTRTGPNDKGLSRKQCVLPALTALPFLSDLM